MLYVVGIMAALIICLGGLTTCEFKEMQALRGDVKARDQQIGIWRDNNNALEQKIGRQDAAVAALATAAENASKAALAAAEAAKTSNGKLAAKEAELLAAKPASENTCASACSLLRQPL